MPNSQEKKPDFLNMRKSFFDILNDYKKERILSIFKPAQLSPDNLQDIEKMAEAGVSGEATYWYGYNLITGSHSFEVNEDKGIEFLIKAADLNYIPAKDFLGDIYCGFFHTMKLYKNAAIGIEYYRNSNSPHGLYRLGYCYYHGLGVEIDTVEGLRLIQEAAKIRGL